MVCTICGNEIENYGNNPFPVRADLNARCCDQCNMNFVIPARVYTMSFDKNTKKAIYDKFDTMSYDDLKVNLLDLVGGYKC